ncbi:hypothetical protein B0H10DRAFT_2430864 [Mycena sp. CBHHK59/15]|nr:hypothetical protein B0H10DRAFT_2430864 [Mycena sp. CBHHK59/15]
MVPSGVYEYPFWWLHELLGPPIVLKPALREVINICDSESGGDVEARSARVKREPKREPSLAAPKPPAGRFRKADPTLILVELKEIPERFPVPDVDTAYILNFSGDSRAKKQTKGGKPKGLDAFLKAEDQDSWGKGSNGSTLRDTLLKVLGDIPSRRSVHKCSGGYKCEFFDPKLLAGYERTDAEDMIFFRVVTNYKKRGCTKSGCSGIPILKKLREGPSKDGKLTFIGCSKWDKGEKFVHRYAAIPADVDEYILRKYLDGSAVPPADLEAHAGVCARFSHPRHGKQTDCPHVHVRDSKAVTGKMVAHLCPAIKVVYTSKDPTKPGHAAKEDVKKCAAAGGMLGETGGHLNNSHTTQAVLGASLDVKHPAFRDTRRLRDEVSKLKSDGTPAGLLWAGILEDYANDLKLPLAERYIHHIRMDGPMKIAVAMNPELVALLHDDGVRFLEGDITFKRTKGEMNEWEAAIWYTPIPKRVTISRIYTNTCTKDAFTHLFDAFFGTVKQVTGKSVRFKAFHPKGNLYSIHFDMEAAQVQGLGSWLSKMVLDDPALRGLFPSIDPDKLVQLILKLCSAHLERSTDELVPLVGQKTVDYLNRIRGLSDPTDIENWHKFCKMHENKKLRDWYAHMVQYPWLLPGYNESLPSFPNGYWQQSPSHTNLVESAHVASNRATKINLLPVEAVRTARIFDAREAASIRAARETCILENRNNHDQVRMRRNVTRTAKRRTYRQEHDEVGDSIAEAQQELAAVTQNKKEVAARLKELKSQKKDLGRVPRHSVSGRTAQLTSSIPRLVGSADYSENEKSDSDSELIGSSSPVPHAASSSPVISPAPLLRRMCIAFPIYDCTKGYQLSIQMALTPSLLAYAEIPVPEFPAPPFTFSDKDIAGLFNATPQSDDTMQLFDTAMSPSANTLPFDMEFFDTFDFNSLALPLGADDPFGEFQVVLPPSSPPPGWPRLPSATPVPPASDSSLTLPAALVPPAPPASRKLLEVDPANMIDGPRARKLRRISISPKSPIKRESSSCTPPRMTAVRANELFTETVRVQTQYAAALNSQMGENTFVETLMNNAHAVSSPALDEAVFERDEAFLERDEAGFERDEALQKLKSWNDAAVGAAALARLASEQVWISRGY